jgi:hypothetical protein
MSKPKQKTAPKQTTHTPLARKSRPQPKKKKAVYHVTNWRDYNESLVSRGAVTVWLGSDAVSSWYAAPTGKAGHPKLYSDVAIRAALTIQAVYHLPLRATEGFVSSLLTLMGLPLKCPDYSTLSYRTETLTVPMSTSVQAALARGEALHIAVDSTGVKIYGEGEWKVRKHGWSKHRTWRKVHLGVDVSSNLIAAGDMTGNETSDSQMFPKLLRELPEQITLHEVSADGAYDTRSSYEVLKEKGAKALIPPKKNARIWQHGNSKAERLARDQNLRRIRRVGRGKWKQEVGYHKRSLSETAMFRFKTIFGVNLPARGFDTQRTQTKIRIAALNKMTLLGMPASVPART